MLDIKEITKSIKEYPEILAALHNELGYTVIPKIKKSQFGPKATIMVNFDTNKGRIFVNRVKIGSNLASRKPIYSWVTANLMLPSR